MTLHVVNEQLWLEEWKGKEKKSIFVLTNRVIERFLLYNIAQSGSRYESSSRLLYLNTYLTPGCRRPHKKHQSIIIPKKNFILFSLDTEVKNSKVIPKAMYLIANCFVTVQFFDSGNFEVQWCD